MKHLATPLGLLVLVSGCNSSVRDLPTAPPPPPVVSSPPPSPPIDPRPVVPISVGQEVTGALLVHGGSEVFELTAPSAGTLVVQITWNAARGVIELRLANAQFDAKPGNPIIARLKVEAGQKYRLTVVDGAPWDYDDLNLPYSLKTAIE